MKINFVILLLSYTISSYGQSPDKEQRYLTALEIESGKGLLNQCSRNTPRKVKSFWKVEESICKTLLDNFEKIKLQKTFSGQQISNLNDYAYQVIGIAIKGNKYIYINAFQIGKEGPEMDEYQKDWRTKPIIFCDGGKSFWGILYDIESNEFSQLSINGIA